MKFKDVWYIIRTRVFVIFCLIFLLVPIIIPLCLLYKIRSNVWWLYKLGKFEDAINNKIIAWSGVPRWDNLYDIYLAYYKSIINDTIVSHLAGIAKYLDKNEIVWEPDSRNNMCEEIIATLSIGDKYFWIRFYDKKGKQILLNYIKKEDFYNGQKDE